MSKTVKKMINMKRITLALSIILSVFFLYSFVVDAQELLNEDMEVEADYGVQETDYAITLTKNQIEAELAYLTEVYTDRFPELGLESVYGSPTDKKDLKDLQESITGDMAPGKESAEMIIKWVLNNITYDKFSGVFIAVPADVVTHGVASCYGIANLCQALMRDVGIPTVVAVGIRWDMEGIVTIADINNDTYFDHNHAWIYAYVDGEWRMYDPLAGVMGTTDKDYISKWYFHEGTEGIIPYYDGLLTLTDIKESSRYIYKDGKFWNYYLGEVYGDNGGIMLDNNGIVFRGKSCHIRDDGFFPSYVYGNDRELENGELYSGGWVLGTSGKDKPIEDQNPEMYLYDNGIGAVKTIKYFCGKPYYVDHNGWLLPIPEDMAETCHLDRGYLTVPVGGEFKWDWHWNSSWYKIWESGNPGNLIEDYSYSFSSEFDNVEISDDGVIKGLKPGGVNVYCTERVDRGNGDIGYSGNLICITVVGDLEECGVTIEDIPDQEYTGKEITPDVIVKNGEDTLYNYLDYRVFYENNIDAGTATVTIKGLSMYSGTITKTFNILPSKNIPASIDETVVVSQKIDTKTIFQSSSYKKYTVTPKENATITNKGILTPKKSGAITVTGYNYVNGQWVPDTDNAISIEIEKPEFKEKTVILNYPGAVMNASENLNEISPTPTKWLISNKKIATIDSETGVVTAVKAGTVKVTAQFGEKKGQIANYSFTVKVVIPAISKKSATMLTGASLNLKLNKAIGAPEWSSEDEAIAEVNESGQVIAHSTGETVITASLDGIEYNCKVNVKKPTLSSKRLSIRTGNTKKLTLKNTKLTDVEWSSSDESIATVDDTGMITAVSKGTAEISTTTGGCTDVCVVTVK